MPQQPYHVYVDLDAVNNDFSSKSPPALRFDETRDYPFLDGDSAEYFCSIVRFSIQTANSLPVFVPEMDMTLTSMYNNAWAFWTAYKISIILTKPKPGATNGDTISITKTLNVQWSPVGIVLPSNAPPDPDQFYVYNYADFLAMINLTFSRLMTEGTIADAMVGYPCCSPFMEMDPNTLKCSLTADKLHFVTDMNGKAVTTLPRPALAIFFSDNLKTLFPSFPYYDHKSNDNLRYQVMFTNMYNVNSIQLNTNPFALSLADTTIPNSVRPGIQVAQEMSGVPLWNPVMSLVFTTSLLPIVPTQTSTPKVYNNASKNISASGKPNISSILADFEVNISPTDQYRPYITYVPPGEYRLIDMYSSYNLNKLDLSVYWKDNLGNLNPFYLQPGCSAHVKLMFRRKDVYKD